MKTKSPYLLLIIIGMIGGCSSPSDSPGKAFKYALEQLLEGNVEEAYNYTTKHYGRSKKYQRKKIMELTQLSDRIQQAKEEGTKFITSINIEYVDIEEGSPDEAEVMLTITMSDGSEYSLEGSCDKNQREGEEGHGWLVKYSDLLNYGKNIKEN